jgi:predicted MFS family arabinose efflux permease
MHYVSSITGFSIVFYLIIILNLAVLIVLEAFLPPNLYINPSYKLLPLSCY